MAVLNRLLRVVVGTGETSTVVGASVPVRFRQSLEEVVTAVAEIVSAQESPALVTNQRVRLDLINRSNLPAEGYSVGTIFRGTLDEFRGVSRPHAVSLLAKGPLARLRRTFDTDYDLSGLPDQGAAAAVLTRCGVTNDSADIDGTGYVLGSIEPVIWRGGQSGAEVLAELDRVFGCATIEIGSARVVRFSYSRVPAHYSPQTYAAIYRRGQAGVSFSEHERARGDLDRIRNYWRIQGLAYEGAEGTADEGCSFNVWATGKAAHAALGAGVYVGPDVFSSDLIQTEARAKAIAQRLMSWWNREPDNIRVVAPTDVDVVAGSLILVRDSVYGVDLASDAAYLVLVKAIDGEHMTLDCVGGAGGALGTLTSGIDRCCGTQQEDGTCTNVGTNPEPDFPSFPGGGLGGIDVPGWPDLPPLPDFEICDPLTDPTCILEPPGGGLEEPPNTEEPFLDCTQTGELVNFTDLPWRETGTPVWRYDAEANETLGVYTLAGTATLTHNTTEAPTAKTSANDVIYAQGETVCISGTVKFCDHDGSAAAAAPGAGVRLHVRLFPADTGDPGAFATATFWAEPGVESASDPQIFGVSNTTENTAAQYDARANAHTCVPLVIGDFSNNGGYEGSPVGFGTEAEFSVCFQTNTEKNKNYYSGDFGAGYMEDLVCALGVEDPDSASYETCSHPGGHILQILLIGMGTTAPSDCPWVELTNVDIGFGTCAPNEEYAPPDQTGGRG